MSKAKIVLLAVLAVALWQAGHAYANSRHDLYAAKVQYVQTTCDAAHREISGASEEACGAAQDRAGMEYLCNGTEANASCWVEVK